MSSQPPRLTDRALVQIRPRILFQLDAYGRVRARARSGLPGAPRIAICRSPYGNRWWIRGNLSATLTAELNRYCAAEPVGRPTAAVPRMRSHLRGLLAAHGPLGAEYRGPGFVVPAVAAVPDGPALMDAHNVHLAQREYPWLRLELPDVQPCVGIVQDGAVVSVCYCARNHRAAAEAGVDTAPAYRRRGYAAAATAAWAAAVQAQGRVALYSCNWTNQASRGVARRLGARMYCEDWGLY